MGNAFNETHGCANCAYLNDENYCECNKCKLRISSEDNSPCSMYLNNSSMPKNVKTRKYSIDHTRSILNKYRKDPIGFMEDVSGIKIPYWKKVIIRHIIK